MPGFNVKKIMMNNGLAISHEQYFIKFKGKSSIAVTLCSLNHFKLFLNKYFTGFLNSICSVLVDMCGGCLHMKLTSRRFLLLK